VADWVAEEAWGGGRCPVVSMLLSTGRVAAAGIACTWHPGHAAAARITPRLEAVFNALA
jgi:hypothetical protein